MGKAHGQRPLSCGYLTHTRPAGAAPNLAPHITTLTVTTTTIALLLALVLLPVLVLLWATESKQQRAQRWRKNGHTQQSIANRLGCSRSTVRRMLVPC